jgi:hypothetical protein
MARSFSLAADVVPTLDESAAERSGRNLADTLEREIGDLAPGMDGGIGGGLGGAAGPGIAGGGALGGALGSAGAGAASGAITKVALSGALGFGILQGVQAFASASPALQQTFGILSDAFELFFRPFGNFLSKTLRPAASALLDMAVRFNDIASDDGLGVAVATISTEAVSSLASGFVNALGNIVTGEGTLADFLFAGAGTIGLAKLVSSTSIGSLLTSTGIGSLLTSSSIGGLLTAVSAGTLISGTVAASALIVGTVGASKLIETGFGPGKPENFQEENQLEAFIQRNISGADPRLSPQEARRQAFQKALERVEDRENLSRADVIAEFRDVTGREPPETGVPGGGGRTGPDAGPPSGDEVEELAEEQRATRQVLENIDESTLTTGQLQNLLPEGAGQEFDPF